MAGKHAEKHQKEIRKFKQQRRKEQLVTSDGSKGTSPAFSLCFCLKTINSVTQPQPLVVGNWLRPLVERALRADAALSLVKDPDYFTSNMFCLDWITSASKFLCPKGEINKFFGGWWQSKQTGSTASHPTPPPAMIPGAGGGEGGELVPGEDGYHRCFDLLLELTSTAHLLYYPACNFLIWYLVEFFCIPSSFQTIREEF